jgi:hypothetical protein
MYVCVYVCVCISVFLYVDVVICMSLYCALPSCEGAGMRTARHRERTGSMILVFNINWCVEGV